MRRTELSYLANEFCIKKQLFQELPDTIVSLENDYGGKAWETKCWQFISICTFRIFFGQPRPNDHENSWVTISMLSKI